MPSLAKVILCDDFLALNPNRNKRVRKIEEGNPPKTISQVRDCDKSIATHPPFTTNSHYAFRPIFRSA